MDGTVCCPILCCVCGCDYDCGCGCATLVLRMCCMAVAVAMGVRAGYLILDKDDPTKILQRESRMLWPKYNWERANQTDPATDWEYYKNCSEYYVTWHIQI